MKNLSKQINEIIKEELSLVNKKINGPVLLDILKYKIIDNFSLNNCNFSNVNIIDSIEDSKFEYELKTINIKLISFKSPVINLNLVLQKNQLIMCLNGSLKIDIENIKTKKIFNYKCIPLTGIILSEGSKCSFSYFKNTIVLELSINDNMMNIEKIENITI